MQVEVVWASADCARRQQLDIAPGTTVAEALAASCFADAKPVALAIYGHVVAPDRVLVAGDRIELLRELLVAPTQARRQRANAERR